MGRTMGGHHAILGQGLAVRVQQLLQGGLGVLLHPRGVELLELRAERLHHGAPRCGVAPVEDDRPEHGFQRIGEHGRRDRRRARPHPIRQAELARHLGEGLLAHQVCAQPGQLAFGKLREAGVELVGDRATEDAVAEEFQPLVVVRSVAAVRQRPLEETRVGERVAEQLYRPLESAA